MKIQNVKALSLSLALLYLFLPACSIDVVDPVPLPVRAGGTEQFAATSAPDVSEDPPQHTPTQALPAPTATPEPEKFSEYSLSARLDYDTKQLAVEATTTYINKTGGHLPDLNFVIDPNRFPGAFRLISIAWEDGQEVTDYSLSGIRLQVPLDEPLKPGESLTLEMSYEIALPAVKGPLGFTSRQTNVADWYPFVPPYLPGEGWVVREAAFVGEHLAYETSNFSVSIQLANPYNNSGQPLTIAASAPARVEEQVHRYRLESARNFAWSVSHLYQLQETKVGDVTVLGYAFPFHQSAEDAALKETAAALALFSEIFGPYPFESLSVVEGDFLDGMEYSGMFFLSHAFYDYHTGNPMGNLTIIAAHEVAHQWWYGLVGNDQALEPWLDEALCTYSELLFYENVYPELEEWWWENRIRFHNPAGWVDTTIYTAGGFYPYRDAVYLRGAMFLDEVRDLLGEEAFFDFLRDYLARYTHRLATGDDFFKLLSEYTPTDLSPLISRYFANR